MLATRSLLPATDPVLQSKVAAFQSLLKLPTHDLPPVSLAKFFHYLRRFPALLFPIREVIYPRRSGLFITFDIHTLSTQAPFLLCSGGDHVMVLTDAWPINFETISKWSQQYRLRDVFVSSSQACSELRALAPSVNWHWLPEGLPRDEYYAPNWDQKSTEVLSFGRKHDELHSILKEQLPLRGVGYAFEPKPHDVLFPTHDEFLRGLGQAKISVCFPSSVTHPQRSGNIETMTVRYLQSMASKCLVYGQSPAELRDLFGYEPVVPVDWSDPAGQLVEILANPEQYIALIERNFETLHSAHTEVHRAQQLAQQLGWVTG